MCFRKVTHLRVKRFITIWGIVFAFSILAGNYALAEIGMKKVLVVNSYHVGYKWTDDITRGILEILGEYNDVLTYVEYLDTKRFSNEFDNDFFYNHFHNKFHGEKFDLIITSDNDALDFVLKNSQSELFNNIPHVSCGIGNPYDYEHIVGLWLVHEVLTYHESIELIMEFFPELQEFVYVTDALTTGQIYIDDLQEMFCTHYPDVELTIYDCINLDSLPDFFSGVAYPSVVYVAVVSSDCNGNPVNEFDVAEIISKSTSAPLFSGYFVESLENFIGGVTMDGVLNGQIAAQIAADLLYRPEIPLKKIYVPEATAVFDYNLLKKQEISLSKLPDDVVLLNKPESFWEKNKRILLISGAIILNLLLIILILYRSVLIHRNLENELRFAIDKSNESNRLKSVFLENVSHEMRTPLNSIIGFSDVLLETMPDDEHKNFVRIISDSALDLNSIISDMFDFSLLKSHKAEIDVSEFDFNDVLKQALGENVVKSQLESKNLQLIINIQPENDKILIKADRDKLFQVLKHIISNAAKYTLSGSVTISCAYATTSKPFFPELTQVHTEKKFLAIGIKDTGKGISKEFMPYLFDPFRQDNEENTNANRGLGLGLSISKSIVEIMGGKVEAESTPDKGTTMMFTIPVNMNELY